MRRDEAIRRLKAAEAELRSHGAAALFLFGSVARDEACGDSDVDVFVDPDPARPFGFTAFMDVHDLLRERLGTKVSYTTRDGLHGLLRERIEQSAIQVF